MQVSPIKPKDYPTHYKWWFFLGRLPVQGKYDSKAALAISSGEPEYKGVFETIIGMWMFLQSIPNPSKMATVSVYLFLYGTKPVWEDPKNINGGRWMFTMKNKENIDETWENLVLELVGFGLDPSAETTGIIMAHRPNYTKFSIWTRDKTSEANILAIGRRIHAEVAPLAVLEYQDHNAEYKTFRHVMRPTGSP